MMSTLKILVSVVLVVGVVGVVNAATDSFDTYADGALADNAYWYSANGPVVQSGIGVGGSKGVAGANDIATMSGGDMLTANKVKWTELEVGDYIKLSMDFQASDVGTFDDDRLGMMYDYDSVTSDKIFGAQLDGNRMQTYFDRVNSISGAQYQVGAGNLNITPDEWYSFTVTLTKMGDYRVLIGATLTTLGGTLVDSGSFDTDSLEESLRPNLKYFTDLENDGLWPAFKNYHVVSGAADNFSFTVVPEPMTLGLLGLGGLALLRRRRA